MAGYSLLRSTFFTQLEECLSDIEQVYSTDARFMSCKTLYTTIRHTNPKLIVSTWTRLVTDKYYDQIINGQLDYFLNKDYRDDVNANDNEYTPTVDNTINELRRVIGDMSDENKAMAMKYVQNLCKLSKLMKTADPNT
jgi:hypothetical protein